MDPSDSKGESLFQQAADHVQNAVASKNTAFNDPTKQLALYGLYKQSLVGACDVKKPGIFNLAGRAKWDAWNKLGSMKCEEAQGKYVELVQEIDGSWQAGTSASAGRGDSGEGKKLGMGPVFSSFAYEEDQQEAFNDSSMHELAGAGDARGVARLLAAGVPVDERDETRCTPLHFAADRGHLELLLLLLDAGASINACDEDEQTPLHYAAMCEHEEACKVLLSRGADAAALDAQGLSPQRVGPSKWSIWMSAHPSPEG